MSPPSAHTGNADVSSTAVDADAQQSLALSASSDVVAIAHIHDLIAQLSELAVYNAVSFASVRQAASLLQVQLQSLPILDLSTTATSPIVSPSALDKSVGNVSQNDMDSASLSTLRNLSDEGHTDENNVSLTSTNNDKKQENSLVLSALISLDQQHSTMNVLQQEQTHLSYTVDLTPSENQSYTSTTTLEMSNDDPTPQTSQVRQQISVGGTDINDGVLNKSKQSRRPPLPSPSHSIKTVSPIQPISTTSDLTSTVTPTTGKAHSGISTAINRQTMELQRDNALLYKTIKEYESTLDVIMGKYRTQVNDMNRDMQQVQQDHAVRLRQMEETIAAVELENRELRIQLERGQSVVRTALLAGEEEERDMIRSVCEMDALVRVWHEALECT